MHLQKLQLANESSICHFNKRHNLVWLSKSVLKPCWPFSWTLSGFPWHKATRSLTTHPLPTPNGMPVYPKITPQALHQATLTYCQYPFILLGGEKHCEKKAFFSQEHNTLTQPGLAPRLFDPKSSHSTIGQLHLPVGRKNCLFDEKCQFENFWFFTLPIPPFYQYLVQIPDLVVQI